MVLTKDRTPGPCPVPQTEQPGPSGTAEEPGLTFSSSLPKTTVFHTEICQTGLGWDSGEETPHNALFPPADSTEVS